MNNTKIPGSLSGNFSITATKSQAVPFALLVLSGISLLSSILFLGSDHPWRSVITFIPTICFSVAGVWLWLISHKSSELEGAAPTEVSNSSSGLRVTTDSRALESKTAMDNLGKILSQVAHREPLPIPDGLIDLNGKPMPHTQDAALKIVEAANSQAAATLQNTTALLCGRKSETAEALPSIPEPISLPATGQNEPLNEGHALHQPSERL